VNAEDGAQDGPLNERGGAGRVNRILRIAESFSKLFGYLVFIK